MTLDINAEIKDLVGVLSDQRNAEPAGSFPRDPAMADHPGLYSWWADEQGLTVLGASFKSTLPPLIYAGQAGATTRRSGTVRVATLKSRIGGNHLRGNIGSSTFRRTLAAVLLHPLGLRLAKAGRLERDSNRALTAWIEQHLSVAIAPCHERATVADLEEAVLAELDPPLNLSGMPRTPVRVQLSGLRKRLGVERAGVPASGQI